MPEWGEIRPKRGKGGGGMVRCTKAKCDLYVFVLLVLDGTLTVHSSLG